MREVMRNMLRTQRDSGNAIHHFQQTQLMSGLKQNDSLLQQSDLVGKHLVEYADDKRHLEEAHEFKTLSGVGRRHSSKKTTNTLTTLINGLTFGLSKACENIGNVVGACVCRGHLQTDANSRPALPHHRCE
jgi:hypothetical protein